MERFLKNIIDQITPFIKRSVTGELAATANNERLTQMQAAIGQTGDNNLVMLQEIEQLQMLTKAMYEQTHNGEFVWKINRVQSMINQEKNNQTATCSIPFFTSHTGFRMCLRIYFNGTGSGENTHASLCFIILKSDHDPLQKWPFTQKVTLYWMNQNHPNNEQAAHIESFFIPDGEACFNRPVDDLLQNDAGYAIERFAPIDTFNDEAFVKDDTMFIKAKVDLRGLEEFG